MREVRLPYLQASEGREPSRWQLRQGDVEVQLGEDHPGWDPSIDVELTRRLVVEGERLREECALGADARVRLLAGWYSENGRSKCFPWRYDLSVSDRFEGTIQLRVPGAELATSVDLVAGVVLVAPARIQPKVAAQIPGSWLWRDVQELRLEHTRGRFPMEWTDFARSGLPAEAPWYLDWPSQSWDAPLLGSLRLRLNETNPTMKGIVELVETDSKRQMVIRAAILDVAKQLVIAALDSDEFVEHHASYPERSVGFCVRLLIAMAFQHESIATVRSLMRDHAGDFHVRLQAGVVPFGAPSA